MFLGTCDLLLGAYYILLSCLKRFLRATNGKNYFPVLASNDFALLAE